MAKFELRGDKELIVALNKLPGEVFRKVFPAAARKSMKPVLGTIKDNIRGLQASSNSERGSIEILAESMGIVQKKYNARGSGSGGTVSTIIGPRKRFKLRTKMTVMGLAGILEFGSVPHTLPGGGTHPGTLPQPFMRRALDGHKGQVIRVFTRELDKGMQRAVKRLAKVRSKGFG